MNGGGGMRAQDNKSSHGADWYYEIDRRTRGPLPWSDLEDLIGRSGETAAEVRIRKGIEGEWTPFCAGSSDRGTTDFVPLSKQSARQANDRRLVRQAQSGKACSHSQRCLEIAMFVAIWIMLNLLFYSFWSDSYAPERRYLATLQEIVDEIDHLRSSGGSDREWQDLSRRTRDSLAPIVATLRKSASSSELARQQLLWCARDLAPKVMGRQSKERDQELRRLKQYLKSADVMLRRR